MKANKNTAAFYTGSDSMVTVATGSAAAFVSAFALSVVTLLTILMS